MRPVVEEMTNKLILECGDQAYWVAIRMATICTQMRDMDSAKLYADAAIELMQKGYHKNPEKKDNL